jgi:hypothetical protein
MKTQKILPTMPKPLPNLPIKTKKQPPPFFTSKPPPPLIIPKIPKSIYEEGPFSEVKVIENNETKIDHHPFVPMNSPGVGPKSKRDPWQDCLYKSIVGPVSSAAATGLIHAAIGASGAALLNYFSPSENSAGEMAAMGFIGGALVGGISNGFVQIADYCKLSLPGDNVFVASFFSSSLLSGVIGFEIFSHSRVTTMTINQTMASFGVGLVIPFTMVTTCWCLTKR